MALLCTVLSSRAVTSLKVLNDSANCPVVSLCCSHFFGGKLLGSCEVIFRDRC